MSTTDRPEHATPPAEVAERRDDEDVFLLDVRTEDDFEEWHIEGSHNVPVYEQLLDGDLSGLAARLDEIPAEKEVIAVCVAGVTSATAAEFLRERGYDATSMASGMRGWGRLHVPYGTPVEGVVQVVRPGTGCLSALVHDDGEGVVVDPSVYVDEYRDLAAERDVDIVGVLDSHLHADHLSGGRSLAAALDVPYYLHPSDARELPGATPIEDGDELPVGEGALAVHHTPGHTPGSVSLAWRDGLLTGDTLFLDGVGRPDLHEGDETDVREASGDLFDSLTRLAELPAETTVLPGHFGDEERRPLAAPLGALREQNDPFGIRDREAFVGAVAERLSEEPANYATIKAINAGEEPLTEDATDLELGPNNCATN